MEIIIKNKNKNIININHIIKKNKNNNIINIMEIIIKIKIKILLI